ncbi:hypothetical protein [Rhizobium beringeri]|uniref:hypothetical protein n=1 Tax=Rhizobium beringeri TaxID=3019934 RepID=UPI003B5A58BD
MGELVTEQLHIEVKARFCRMSGPNMHAATATVPDQYACCHRADAEAALPGSIATASTLAFALVHKYVDGTPLYRLSQASSVQAFLSAVVLSAIG